MNRLSDNLKIVNGSNFFNETSPYYKKNKKRGLYKESLQQLGNNYVRYRIYEIGIYYGYEALMGRNGIDGNKTENRKKDLARSRNNIMDLARSNFNSWDRFMTLTYRSEMKDLKVSNREFSKFMMRLKNYSKSQRKIKYLCVVQFQDLNRDDVIHYHIMTDLNYIPKAKLEELWDNGWVKINRMNRGGKAVDDVGLYLITYLGKSKNKRHPERDLLIAKKSYFSSRGLKVGKKLIGTECVEMKQKLKLFKDDGTPNKTVASSGIYDVPMGKDKKGNDRFQRCFQTDFILNPTYKKRAKIQVCSTVSRGYF